MLIRALGLLLSLAYAVVIVWLYAAQPQTMAEVTGVISTIVNLKGTMLLAGPGRPGH